MRSVQGVAGLVKSVARRNSCSRPATSSFELEVGKNDAQLKGCKGLGFGLSVRKDVPKTGGDEHAGRCIVEETSVRWRPLWTRASVFHAEVKQSASRSLPLERTAARCLFTGICKDHAALQTLSDSDAVGDEMLHQLKSIVEKLRFDSSARVLIVCSAVPRVFCAGADLKERRSKTPAEVQKYGTTLRSTFTAIETLPIPSIAVVEGAALGGGLELALACDMRICGMDAVLGLPETSHAIIPGAGGTQRLPRLIGRARAKELIFTARRVYSSYGEKIGLVNHYVEAGEAFDKAVEIAREIMQPGPIGVRMAKIAIDRGVEVRNGHRGSLLRSNIAHKRQARGVGGICGKEKTFLQGGIEPLGSGIELRGWGTRTAVQNVFPSQEESRRALVKT